MPKKPKLIRKLRHWKQRFDKNAAFIWRRQLQFQGVLTKPGELIPEVLADNATKLRRFWESNVIELAEFDSPNVATGIVDKVKVVYQEGQHVPVDGLLDDVVIYKAKGSWFTITVGDKVHKVNGQKKLDAAVEALLEDAKAAEAQAKADAGAQEKAEAAIQATIAAAAEVGVEITAEILAELDEEQRVELETYITALAAGESDATRPEFLPDASVDAGNGSDGKDEPTD